MGENDLFAESLVEQVCGFLRRPAAVAEYQGALMAVYLFGEQGDLPVPPALSDPLTEFEFEFVTPFFPVPNDAYRSGTVIAGESSEECRHRLQRSDRRRQTYALQAVGRAGAAQGFQTFDIGHQQASPLRARHHMDFIEDHRIDIRKIPPSAF
jgi:hypothetical protein